MGVWVTIEEVIAIAKTLRPGIIHLHREEEWSTCEGSKPYVSCHITWSAPWSRIDIIVGKTWEQALQKAGWKG